jgi:hypothetical protein
MHPGSSSRKVVLANRPRALGNRSIVCDPRRPDNGRRARHYCSTSYANFAGHDQTLLCRRFSANAAPMAPPASPATFKVEGVLYRYFRLFE